MAGSVGWKLLCIRCQRSTGDNISLFFEEHDETVLTVDSYNGWQPRPRLPLLTFITTYSCIVIEAEEWKDGAVLGCAAEPGLLK